MVYRYGWVAGLAAAAFALWRLDRLLEPTPSGLRWEVVVVTAFLAGLAITWAATRSRAGGQVGWVVLLNLVLFGIAAVRYAAPGSPVLPDSSTFALLAAELDRAGTVIRHGVEPVLPIVGLVVVLGALFWALGAVLAYGLLRDRPYLALVAPLVVGLQLLTIERAPSSPTEIAVFVSLVAAAALSVGLDEHGRGAGRMSRSGPGRRALPLPLSALAMVSIVVVSALGVSAALAGRVPADGAMDWRAPGGLAAGRYGSISYDPFIDIHRGLVSLSDTTLFTAALEGAADPRDVYYRLVTLDVYDEDKWYAADDEFVAAGEGSFESEGYTYAGPTSRVATSITIDALSQDFLPAPYAVRAVSGADSDTFRFRTSDASVLFSGSLTYPGMSYRVEAEVPETDSSAVAFDAAGRLSPLFVAAAEGGETVPTTSAGMEHRDLPDADRYLQLPDLDPRIKAQADLLTRKFSTDFEKGVALEYWFRKTGSFEYSLEIEPGPPTLAGWLFDENHPGYRTGYCKHFALSMGVMARSVGIPARVVIGFLPAAPDGAGTITVTGRLGHAWVELWIPSQGWMRFDPTPRGDNPGAAYLRLSEQLDFDLAASRGQVREAPAGQGETEFPAADEELQPRPSGVPVPVGGAGTRGPVSVVRSLLLSMLLLATIAAAMVPGVKWVRRRSRMRRLSQGEVAAAWEEIVARLADLDRPVDPAATPSEVADAVDPSLRPLASIYAKAIYGPKATSTPGELEAANRSMTLTEQRLGDGLSAAERVRAAYRLGSLLGGPGLRRWLPWLRR